MPLWIPISLSLSFHLKKSDYLFSVRYLTCVKINYHFTNVCFSSICLSLLPTLIYRISGEGSSQFFSCWLFLEERSLVAPFFIRKASVGSMLTGLVHLLDTPHATLSYQIKQRVSLWQVLKSLSWMSVVQARLSSNLCVHVVVQEPVCGWVTLTPYGHLVTSVYS